ALRDRIANAIGRIPLVLPIEHRRAAADAVLAVLPEPADRAAVYAEVADRLAADAEQGGKDGLTRIYRRSAARQVRAWGDELRRMADETQQPTAEASFIPTAHYRRDDGVECCVHTIPVGPNSCPACREIADDEAQQDGAQP
ncbi:hypothetical protein ABT314_42870, partial [Streptomyces spiralis]